MKVLINAVGFIGDNLFASSVARRIKYENRELHPIVHFKPSVWAPFELLCNDPNIDKVVMSPNENYSQVINLSPIHRKETPIKQFQQQAGLNETDNEYSVYTNKAYDNLFAQILSTDKINVAYQTNWEEKSFLFTKEEYERGIDVPNLGYGGSRRNIKYILDGLSSSFNMVPIGKPNGYNVKQSNIDDISEFTRTASLIKNCDLFIGAEGGLSNLAAAVGTDTIITGDFVHQLYGWNGVIEKNEEPKLGPKYYDCDGKHITLDPYLTDNEVIEEIIRLGSK